MTSEQFAQMWISIHAPREGSDVGGSCDRVGGNTFQSTLPARGATIADWTYTPGAWISIHAPREGSDPAYRI